MKSGNQNDLAELADVSRQLVNKYVAQGKIPKQKDGTIDLGKALQILNKIKTKGKGNGNGNGKPPGLWDEQARLAGHKADIAEMESKKMAGQLVEVDLVMLEFNKFVAAVRSRLLAVSTKIAPTAAKKSAAVVQKIIHGAITEALSEFRHYNADTGECRPPRVKKTGRKRGGKIRTTTRPKRKRVVK